MKYQGNTGKLRKAMDSVGLYGTGTFSAFIFNDIRKKSGYRRLKVWRHFDGGVEKFLELQDACRKEFGWNLISCGLVRTWHGGVNFIVKLKV